MCWDKTKQKWKAQIYIDGKSKTIGIYDDETEAARAYDATVRAQSLDKPLNFPDDLSTAPGVYVPKKEASRIVEISWGELGQDEAEVGGEAQNRWEVEVHRQLRRRDGSSASVRRHCSSAEPRQAAQLSGRSLYCT